jgi:hypothetical protein
MDVRERYRRLGEWLRSLSRVPYAVLAGVTSGLSVLAIGALLGDSVTFEAAALGISMTGVYYALDPNGAD